MQSLRLRYMDIVPEREDILHAIPKIIPDWVYIEPTNNCNFSCPFCPTGNPELIKRVNREKGIMDIQLFKKIISDLKDMVQQSGKKITRIQLYKDGEPLLHKDFDLMVSIAKEADIALSIETTTNASMLTNSISEKIVEAGLDVIRISVEHVDEAYYSLVSKGKTSYAQIKENVEYLYEINKKRSKTLHIHAKLIDTGLTQEQIDLFVDDFKKISDSWNINFILKWPSCDIEGYECLAYGANKEKSVCTEPFTKLAFNFNGLASVCCMDWSHGTVVGDVSQQNVSDIWNSKELNKMRIQQLNGERFDIPTCAFCDYVYGLPDIDNSRDELLSKFQSV